MSWKAFQNYNKFIIVLVWVLIIVYYYDCKATACAQDAVEDRVTVVLQSGEAVRVALPFAPAGPLPKLALDALHQVLPTGLFHSLATKHLLSPGDATRQLVCNFSMSPLCFLVIVSSPYCKVQCSTSPGCRLAVFWLS